MSSTEPQGSKPTILSASLASSAVFITSSAVFICVDARAALLLPCHDHVLATGHCAALAVLTVTQLIAIYAWLRVATSVMTLLSLWRLRRTAPELPRRFLVPGGRFGMATVVVLPILFFAWALINSDPQSRLWGPLCLACGPLAYAFVCRRKAAARS